MTLIILEQFHYYTKGRVVIRETLVSFPFFPIKLTGEYVEKKQSFLFITSEALKSITLMMGAFTQGYKH